MKFLLGTKGKMTTVFDGEGRAHAATVLLAGPVVVTQVKSKEKDGYEAVQIGYGEKRESLMKKPQKGHVKDLGNFRHFREYREDGTKVDAAVGTKFDVSVFAVGDKVTVSATSKGKGFQGVVKRHGFKGGPRSHGQKHNERAPGSIGGGGRQAGRVIKGMRMAGRMGGDRITVKNLKVLQVVPETGEILLKGAIPGVPGSLVEIYGN